MTSLALPRRFSSRSLTSSGSVILGNVRVQALSSTLVRIELKGPKGFEDRPSFTVPVRGRPIAPITIKREDGKTCLTYPDFEVVVPQRLRSSLAGVQIRTRSGEVLMTVGKSLPGRTYLPGPSERIPVYAIADQPRLIPPEWGATPAPEGNEFCPETSGWDSTNDSADLFVFVPGAGGYEVLRRDFLALTGPIPIPPLWSFGFWDSQWYPYTEQLALQSIDLYREKHFPLDVFVVDTDWRINGSHGYDIATDCFPDMGRFLREAHKRGVRLMYNDHPEPVAKTALAPEEIAFRWQGLTSLLNLGLDSWWFDRNWHTKLHEPVPGISKEVWGQCLFHDIALRTRPKMRPLIMSNAEGIDNGNRNAPPHPAGHRYPIMWTGDTFAEWRYLQMGIANAVDLGIESLHPYLNEDLGGHHGHPTKEYYTRFLQFGAFCPTMRVHCTLHQERHPWGFGDEVEAIVHDYVRLRYRLLPMIYSAAKEAYDKGEPLLRRGDLEWPEYPEANDPQQFLFGPDIFVAPINDSRYEAPQVVASEFLRTPTGAVGLSAEYFANSELEGRPTFKRVDRMIDFPWKQQPIRRAFPKENISVRWSGKLGPVPETGEYILSIAGDDGIRMWFDGKLMVDQWIIRTIGEDQFVVQLEAGKSYPIRIELMQKGGPTEAKLAWVLPSQAKPLAQRSLWIPPGEWRNAWTGELVQGPKRLVTSCDLRTTPLFFRQGSLILATDATETAGPMPWKSLTVEAFPPRSDGTVERSLYEDDGETNAYLAGSGRTSLFTMARSGRKVTISCEPHSGTFGADTLREVILRLHVPQGFQAVCDHPMALFEPLEKVPPIPLQGKGSRPCPGEGPVAEVRLSAIRVGEGFSVTFELQ